MAFKKIAQDFVLSDSSVNVYGFKLLTTGCLMDEVLKNPIGYYNHDKVDGVLCKWEDVRLSGDQILGKPTINMEHPRAERTIKEIEDGFLNAASVGHICLLDHDFETNPADEENPILVGKKWYYKEASLVDSPGNRNAFKAKLFDAQDNEINLTDLTQLTKIKTSNMKEVKLAITPALITLLGLSDDPTPSEVGKGITALHDRAEKAEKTLQDLKDEQTGKEVDAHLSTAFTAKKITPEQKVLLKKQYATKPNDLKDLLDSMVGFSSVVNKINQENTERQGEGTLNLSGDDKNLFDQGWDKLHKSGKLKDLKDTNEPAWRELYKGKYGYYPNEKPQRK